MLYERTEGWAAGLRLAALSLAGHPDPGRFAAEFSGSERTVAEYLLAEVLDRQSGPVRRLLLRTSVLDRVNGELADLLTGGSGGERVLQQLERANTFVAAVDARRSWFRYHQLFADLLQLELRGSAPAEVPALHAAAAGWYAGHGYLVEAVRHAQAAQDWALAARLLADHWVELRLNGLGATADELLARFPAGLIAADAELAAPLAWHELERGSLQEAERHVALAAGGLDLVPADRRGRLQVALAVVRLRVARQRGDLRAVAGQAHQLLDPAADTGPARLGVGEDLRALTLISLGIAEVWTARFEEADRHLGDGIALAHRIGRPLPGGHRRGALGTSGMAVLHAGSAAQQAGDRAGRAARLDRGRRRRHRLRRAGHDDDRRPAATPASTPRSSGVGMKLTQRSSLGSDTSPGTHGRIMDQGTGQAFPLVRQASRRVFHGWQDHLPGTWGHVPPGVRERIAGRCGEGRLSRRTVGPRPIIAAAPWRSEQEPFMSDIHDDRAALFANLESAETQPKFSDHVADDVDWTVEGTHALCGRYRSKADFIAATFDRLHGVLVGGAMLKVRHIYVDGGTTIAELRSSSKTQRGAGEPGGQAAGGPLGVGRG